MSLWATANKHQISFEILISRTSGGISLDFSQYLTQLGSLLHILHHQICITFLNKWPPKRSTRKMDKFMWKTLTVILGYYMFCKTIHKPPQIEMFGVFFLNIYKCFLHVSWDGPVDFFLIRHRITKCMFASIPVG